MSGLDANTKLLLHCDGVDEAVSFPDASASEYTVTPHGGAQVDTAHSVFGGASAFFNGTDSYLSVPYPALGSGDFTIDCRLRLSSLGAGSTAGIFSHYASADNRGGFNYSDGTGLVFFVRSGGANKIIVIGACALSLSTWYHVAVVRSGSTFYLFLDGSDVTASGGTSSEAYPDYGVDARVGLWNNDVFTNGHVDEFRVSDVARWTSAFTPPTLPYSFDSSTPKSFYRRSYPIDKIPADALVW
jgi:hypothetical protein